MQQDRINYVSFYNYCKVTYKIFYKYKNQVETGIYFIQAYKNTPPRVSIGKYGYIYISGKLTKTNPPNFSAIL